MKPSGLSSPSRNDFRGFLEISHHEEEFSVKHTLELIHQSSSFAQNMGYTRQYSLFSTKERPFFLN